MVITQGNMATVYRGLQSVLLKAVEEAPMPEDVKDFAFETPSTSAEEQFPTAMVLGDLEELLDQYTYTNLGQFVQTVRNLYFGRILRIPRAHVEDDQIGMHTATLLMFGQLAATHPYRRIPQLFINGFTTAWIDGANQFSATHTWPGGQAWGNLTLGPLNLVNYRAAGVKLFARPGPDGQALELKGTHLVFGPSNEIVAKQIVGLDTLPGGGSNPDYDPDMKLVKWGALTGAFAAYWYLVAAGDQGRPVVIQNRDAPALVQRTDPTDSNVFDQETFEYKVSRRYGEALVLPHLVEASQWGASGVTTTTAAP